MQVYRKSSFREPVRFTLCPSQIKSGLSHDMYVNRWESGQTK